MKSSNILPLECVLNSKEKRFIFSLKHGEKAWNYKYNYSWAKGDYGAIHTNSHIYSLPYEKGSKYKVSQSCNGSFTHKGKSQYAIDFSMPINTYIYSVREGKVVDIKDDSTKGGNSKAYSNDANYIMIEHNDGTLGGYYHLAYNGVAVKINQFIKKGDFIGYSGNTGYTRGPHLHFEVTSATKKGKSVSYPVKFSTNAGVVTCPKKNTYPVQY